MSSNPTQIVHQLRQDFQELIEFVTNAVIGHFVCSE